MKNILFSSLLFLVMCLLLDDSFYFEVSFFNLSPIDFSFLWLMFALAIYLLINPRVKISPLKISTLITIVLFGFLLLIYLPVGISINENIRLSLATFEGLILAAAILLIIDREEQLEYIGRAFFVVSIIASIVSIGVGFSLFEWPFIDKNPPSREVFSLMLPWSRNAGLFSNYSAFYAVMLIGLAYGVVTLSARSFWRKILQSIFIMLIVLGFLMPQSRAGMVSMLFFFLSYWIFQTRNTKFFLGAVWLIVLTAALILNGVIEAIISIGSTSADTRFEQYIAIAKMFPDVLFIGNGLGTYIVENKNSIHNIYLNVFTAFGGVTLFVFLLLISKALKGYFRIFSPAHKRCFTKVRIEWTSLGFASQCILLAFASGLSVLAFWIMLATTVSAISIQQKTTANCCYTKY